MNQNDLYIKYARIIKMCKGTALESTPWLCVKYDGEVMFRHPAFDVTPKYYEFAIAILEDKPVFVGDTLYDRTGDAFKVTEDCVAIGRMITICSWQPPKPKRTFMLNGVELPCPSKKPTDHFFRLGMCAFGFNTKEDVDCVLHELTKILIDAQNKP